MVNFSPVKQVNIKDRWYYIYGYVNRVQSSRRLEREAGRSVEVMCLEPRAFARVSLSSNSRIASAFDRLIPIVLGHTPKVE